MDNDGHGTQRQHHRGPVNNGEGVTAFAPNAKIMALRRHESGGRFTSGVLGRTRI